MATLSTVNPVEPRLRPSVAKAMLNKVPEVTLYFWVIKVLCTTVGETAADYLNDEPRLRPDQHDLRHVRRAARSRSFFQFRLRRYVPGVYWLAVVLISIVGTLITDNLTDNFGVVSRDDHDRLRVAARGDLRGLVRERADALDPHDRHDAARGVLLARDPVHVRARARRRAT